MAARYLSEIVEFYFKCECVAFELLVSEAFNEFGGYVVELNNNRGCAADVAFEGMFATD